MAYFITCLPPPGGCTGSECPWLRALDLAGRQHLDMTLDQGPCPSLGRTWVRVQAAEPRIPWVACAASTCGYTQRQPGDLEPPPSFPPLASGPWLLLEFPKVTLNRKEVQVTHP